MARSRPKPKNKPGPKGKKPEKPTGKSTPVSKGSEKQPGFDLSALNETITRGMQGSTEGMSIEMPETPLMESQDIQSLQRLLGNRATESMVQRWFDFDFDAAREGIPQDLYEFREEGPYPERVRGKTIAPSTGMGGFNARYDPDSMELTITLNIGFNFVDGVNIGGDNVIAQENSLEPVVDRINDRLAYMDPPDKAVFLNQVRDAFQWTGIGDPRISTWMEDYKKNVESAWGSAETGIAFQSSRPGWEEQQANVNIEVNTTNITSNLPGAPIPGPQPAHCRATIYKTPEQDEFGAYVKSGDADKGDDQELFLGSGQVYEGGQSHGLRDSVYFDSDSAELNAEAIDRLNRMIISFQAPAGGVGTSIDITGRASARGEGTERGRQRNIELAEARAVAVGDYLRSTAVEGRNLENVNRRIHTMTGAGAAGADTGMDWQRVDIVFAGGERQNIAAHEFGHMIGLDDEYAGTPERVGGAIQYDAEGNMKSRGTISGSEGEVGQTTGHNQLGRDMGVGGSIYENNENMMSLGSTVRPQHYATFMQALHEVTGLSDWRLRR